MHHAAKYNTVTFLQIATDNSSQWRRKGAMASQITGDPIVYSTVYSGADQRKHQSSTSLAFVKEFTGHRWIPLTKG